MSSLSTLLAEFDKKFSNLTIIDKEWYQNNIGVKSFCKKASKKDSKGKFSEEYVRARFIYALVYSGMYQKEYICVEFGFPKGNGGKSLNPDIIVFKNKNWEKDYEDAKANKNFSKIRQNVLVIFEAKKNGKSVADAIENQLRCAMELNTSKDRIFGVYFDDQPDILIFKKIGNSEIRRFNESSELQQDGIYGWNLDKRDLLIDLPSQKDFIENNKSISDLSKLKLDSLDAIDEVNFTELMNRLKRANDSIQPTSPERDLIVEFLTLKVFDEKRSKRDNRYLDFYIKDDEKRQEGLAEKSFRERINNLYTSAQKEYPKVLDPQKRIFSYDSQLRPNKGGNDERFLIALVEIFQKRAILKAKNESFNQIIFNNFGSEKQKADKGQFFTPIPVVKNIIKMLNPIRGEELCDPCCGICDFPAMAFRHSHRKEADFPPNASNFYGFDLESGNLKLAELNLVLNGDGGAILEQMDSLAQKLLINDKVMKKGDFTTSNYDMKTWENLHDKDKDIKRFKIIATNPPFGKGRDLKTGANGTWDLPKETIKLYETFHNKLDLDASGNQCYPNSMDMGALFLENAYKCLEYGGRMAIVLSNSIASIKEWQNVRKWFIERMRIVGIFDLPSNTFGETGVATTVIIAYKPKLDEQFLLTQDYQVFIKEIVNIGYEVKTKQRAVHFEPQYIIDEETFEKTSILHEDFSSLQKEWKSFLQYQEEEIKQAFHLDMME
ncbi:HsdM family class I SAM-dependent methyltransferase [Helicobacter cetorum]|uniref:N-6 DNA methylase n=1 Tax=Helicobacter cetorum (strain ATCC BAA-429 / MIT 00-7128) TaxID=182217 RepID=I0ENN0_HELC0|nr:N-6 DNA methylase [Helicobacter cetorum]AFI04549.1 N-6 DNA methylase [Helicobacter cetorum MIT 00-7128]